MYALGTSQCEKLDWSVQWGVWQSIHSAEHVKAGHGLSFGHMECEGLFRSSK